MKNNETANAARFNLEGRHAFVTGASLGIGNAIARALASAGAEIAMHASSLVDHRLGHPDAIQATRSAIRSLGRRAEVIDVDFETPGAGRKAAELALVALGSIDILVICASVQCESLLVEASMEGIARQVAVDFQATIELLQAVLPNMERRGWGRVLSIGSVNQTRPNSHLAIYAALKAAQHNLIVGLARQYASKGVLLNTLSPGLVATPRNQHRRKDTSGWDKIQKRVNPMGRAADPEEMVGAALLLCSDASSYITGIDLPVTGGGHL